MGVSWVVTGKGEKGSKGDARKARPSPRPKEKPKPKPRLRVRKAGPLKMSLVRT